MRTASLWFTCLILGNLSLTACEQKTAPAPDSATTPASAPTKLMHASWDADNNGINDCETNGSCDHTIDYTQPRPAPVNTPAFDCSSATDGTIQHLICQDPILAQLDQQLASVYAAATAKAISEDSPLLKTEQDGWTKGRDECWKSDDKYLCVKTEYERRIAELQARYQLVSATGPIKFHCGDSATDEILVTFYASDTPTLIAERNGATSLMYQAPAASGSKYQGRNESLWEHQGETRIVWGYDTPELVCTQAK